MDIAMLLRRNKNDDKNAEEVEWVILKKYN